MRLASLEYGSLLSYTPRGSSTEMQRATTVMNAIKTDDFIEQPPIQMSQWLARTIHQNMGKLPFAFFFQPDTVLVPVPKSSLMQPDTLWVPDRIATAMVKNGIGREVLSCLARVTPLRKSARSEPSERPHQQSNMTQSASRGAFLNPPK